MPVAGRYLEGIYIGEEGCDGNGAYVLADTSCNLNPITRTDQEIDCGVGVHGYSTLRVKLYSSNDNTCSGTQPIHYPEIDSEHCTIQGVQVGAVLVEELAREHSQLLYLQQQVMGNALAEANRLGEVGRKDEMKRIFGIEM